MKDTLEGAYGYGPLMVGLALAVLVGWSLWWVIRYIRADAMTRQSIRQAIRVRRGWKRLAPMLKLSATDKTPTVLAALSNTDNKPIKPRVLVPALKVTHDEYGVIARATCLPGVGLEQFQKAAPHLADAWRAPGSRSPRTSLDRWSSVVCGSIR